jgi:hypothetical protein
MTAARRYMSGVLQDMAFARHRSVAQERAATAMTPADRMAAAACRRPTAAMAVAAALAAATIAALQVHAGLAEGPGTPASIVAAQIRAQGYACAGPVAATRDRRASRPNGAVWTLRCRNASYRVRLVPDMAAEVARIE